MRFATATAASLIFPFAPHLGSEVYERLDRRAGLGAALAEADPALLASDTVTLVVQVNGKLRDRIEAAAEAPKEELLALARAQREGRQAPRRQGGRQGDRRARQAGQPGGPLDVLRRHGPSSGRKRADARQAARRTHQSRSGTASAPTS